MLPAAVFVALVAVALAATMQRTAYNDRASARAAVLTAATAEVHNLLNISYRTADRDLGRIVAGATGPLARQFATQRSQLQGLTSDRSETTGSVLSAGLVMLDLGAGSARVEAAADASVVDATHPQAVVKHYRWVLTLLRVHGRWLVADAALAGVPQ